MIIHSIISQNDIFFTDSISQPSYKNINGGFVEFSYTDGIKRISRLHSTNPHLYLDKHYAPYNIIN